jgi:hypothetical protein
MSSRATTLAVALAITSALSVTASAQSAGRDDDSFNSTVVAQQLGTQLAPNHDGPFALGRSVTGQLNDPSRLSRYGLGGASQGARVTAFRKSEDHIIVYIDEVSPTLRSRKVELKVDKAGKLTPVSEDVNLAKGPQRN